jgi:hypothetical protein
VPIGDRRRAAPTPRERGDEREPESGAGSAAAAASAREALEDPFLLAGLEARPLVEDREIGMVVVAAALDGYRAAGRVVECVLDQVVEDDREVFL